MKPRDNLPDVTDHPKAAFLNGWWAGIGVGFISAISLVVVLAKAVT